MLLTLTTLSSTGMGMHYHPEGMLLTMCRTTLPAFARGAARDFAACRRHAAAADAATAEGREAAVVAECEAARDAAHKAVERSLMVTQLLCGTLRKLIRSDPQ